MGGAVALGQAAAPGLGTSGLFLGGVGSEVDGGAAWGQFSSSDVFSVEAWINTTNVTGSVQHLVTRHGDQSGTFNWALQLSSTGTMELRLDVPLSVSQTVTGNTFVADGDWHHVQTSFENGSILMNVDGQIDAIDSTAGLVGVGAQSARLYLGRTTAEVAIYDYVLSTPQILTHYSAGITPIPGPSTVILLGMGLGAMAIRRR